MPRTYQEPPYKRRQSTDKKKDKKVTLISFVIHSFNRLRGKADVDEPVTAYQKTYQKPQARNQWQAVSIVPDFRGCAASKSLKDKRFLGNAAPSLPLPGCTAETCSCRYKHYTDRREGPRRADELGVHVHMADPQHERRSGRGRRSTDR